MKQSKQPSPFNWRGQPSASGESLMRNLKFAQKKPLEAPQRTTLLHSQKQKQQPGVGAMRTA